jgi:hypothetical protein
VHKILIEKAGGEAKKENSGSGEIKN